MRVGLIIYGRLDTVSGGYLYDRHLVEYLRDQGDEVETISLPWSNYGRHLTHNLSRPLFDRLRSAPFDLLLQDELNHPSLFWLNRRLRPYISYPLVSIVHHLRGSEMRPAWQNQLYGWVERRYLHTVDGFIFNSRTTQAVVNRFMTCQRPAVVANPAGDRFRQNISPAEVTARAHEDGPLRLIFVGNLIPRKGLHTLLAALARLPNESYRLSVIGDTAVDPAYTSAIHQQINADGLSDQVDMRGVLVGADLAAQFRRAHLLAVPSDYEGFGIVYLEGMGFGLPAIATTSGAAHEIITPEKDGFLVESGDVAILARYISELVDDRARLAQMGLAARERFLRHPSWAESMALIREFIQSFLGNYAQASPVYP